MPAFLQAVINDLAGNLEATRAVLADIERVGATEIVCLGNFVRHGADPLPVITMMKHCASVTVRGRYDLAAAGDFQLTSSHMQECIERFRRQIAEAPNLAWADDYLRSLPESHTMGSTKYIHGSPRTVYGYVIAHDEFNQRKMATLSQHFEKLCFCGYAEPGLFIETRRSREQYYKYYDASRCDERFPLADRRIICNVGSVGEPGGHDARSSYVLFDGEALTFRRVEYDIESAVTKMLALDNSLHWLADRLRRGR